MAKGKILVIDDDIMVRRFLDDILQNEGYQVQVAASGREALEWAAKDNFDVALVDIKMPDLDGMEVLCALQEIDQDLKVLLITGYPSLETAIQAVRLSAFDYLPKPLENERVLIGVQNALAARHLAVTNRQFLHDLQRANAELAKASVALKAEITERKRAEEALRDAELRYRTVANFTYDWEYWERPDGTLCYVSPACERISGYAANQFIDNPLLLQEIVLPEDREIWARHRHNAIEAPELREVQLRIRRRDGETVWIEHACQPVADGLGAFLGVRSSNRDITERKRTEEALRRQSAVLDAINKVFLETLTCESDEEVARTCLAVAEELTGSKFGFICEVNQAGRFDAIAISDPGWDACRIPKTNAVLMLKDMEIRGIRGRVVKDERAMIFNDPASHPDWVGSPEGHPRITSFLGVPLKHAGSTIGMIGLANKELGYDLADQQAIEILSVAFVEALNRKRADEALSQRADDLAALYEASQVFLSHLDTETIIENVCRLGVDRFGPKKMAWVGLLVEGSFEVRPAFAYGFEEGYLSSIRITWDDSPTGRGPTGTAIRTGQATVMNHIESDPTYAPWREEAKARGYRSSAALPLSHGERILGALNVYSAEPAYFTDERVQVLQSFANQAAIAIENARLLEAVMKHRGELQRLSAEIIKAQEAERKRISRELDDALGQALTGLKLLLEMSARLPANEFTASLGEAQALVNELVAQVRDLSLDLRPSMLDDLGLLPALLWHFDRYTARTNVRVIFKHTGLEERRFGAEVETAAYRIVQEALTNVARHAGVDQVTVRAWADQDTLGMQIEDLGTGFDPGAAVASATIGLAGMRERAGLLRGQLTVESALGVGTRVTAELSLGGPAEEREKGR